MNRRLVLGLQGLVSAVLLVWLFRGLDPSAMLALFQALPGWFYIVSFAVVLGGQVLYAWRWGVLLRAAGVAVPFLTLLRHYFVGIFANNFMPGTIGGDVVKIFYVGREYGYRGVTASVIVDRVLGIGILAAAGAAVSWSQPGLSPRFTAVRLALSAVAVAAIGVLALAVSGSGGLVQRLGAFGPRSTALANRLQRFRLAMAASLMRPAVFGQALLVVVGYFLCLTLVYSWFVEISASGRPAFVPLFIAVTSAAVLSNVPVALNGIGVREQLHAWLLGGLGVPRTTAVAISLLLYGHTLLTSLIGLVGWLNAPPMPDQFSEDAL
jgi:uncharacterized protein (TIRG00374 family)